MKRTYVPWNPRGKSLVMVRQAQEIAELYRQQGYDLTLRQLYYQFVARGLLPNKQSEYKRLGSVINDARLGGLFDWSLMVDRTRNVAGGDTTEWEPEEFMRAVAESYTVSLWTGQSVRIEVWVEKEALAGVVKRAADHMRVPYFSCRGYVSQSEMWGAAQRLEKNLFHPLRNRDGAEKIVILHLGDHDPSGIDMTRDIRERLSLFLIGDGYNDERVQVKRIALNMDQIRRYDPPPNPAKETDSRFESYIMQYGDESWELDALDPATLDTLIRGHIAELMGEEGIEMYQQRLVVQERERIKLRVLADHFEDSLADHADEIEEKLAEYEPEELDRLDEDELDEDDEDPA